MRHRFFRKEAAHGRDCGGFGRHRRFFGALRQGSGEPPGFRAAKMLSAEDLQLIILALLADGPRHGYDIIRSLKEHSSGLYAPSPGVVYPALTYLEEAGYAQSETEGSKRLYHLTEGGTAYLAQHRATADELLARLARYGQRMADIRREYTEEEEAGQDWGSGGGEQDRAQWRQLRAEFQGLRQDLKRAIFEKLHAPLEEKRRVLEVLRRAIAEIRGAGSAGSSTR